MTTSCAADQGNDLNANGRRACQAKYEASSGCSGDFDGITLSRPFRQNATGGPGRRTERPAGEEDGAHTHTRHCLYSRFHKDTLLRTIGRCGVPIRAVSLRLRGLYGWLSLLLSASWIKQVCLRTATCLNTPLIRLRTLGFQQCSFFSFLCHVV